MQMEAEIYKDRSHLTRLIKRASVSLAFLLHQTQTKMNAAMIDPNEAGQRGTDNRIHLRISWGRYFKLTHSAGARYVCIGT